MNAPASAIVRRPEPALSGDWPAHLSPLLQRLYAARGAHSLEQAQPRLAQLVPPETLGGLDAAVDLLQSAIDGGRHIVVVGDFDCDGATACAVAVRGLRMLGASHVSHAVPDRMVHGYGLSPALVDELAALKPDLLVTVDHGIACHAGIARARALGWQVLVTDHHLPGEQLPDADVIVNPNLRGDAFPSKALAGVGVMFYVLLALRARWRALGRQEQDADLARLLDLVAVGTIADLVPLDANNRALVAAGLRRLRSGQGNPGLMALAAVSGRELRTLDAADVGYAIAPRINAAGRLEDMALGIACLLTEEPSRALELAEVLHAINAERRTLQQEMVEEAEAAIAGLEFDGRLPPVLCLMDPGWHPGVVGLVASKIKERVHRPVLAFAPAGNGSDDLRGSARSIPGFHIRDALAAVDAAHPGLIPRFGGHAMAAGLRLPRAAFEAFREALQAQVAATLDPALLRADIWSDGPLTERELDRHHAELLREGGPWGQGYPEPVFDGEFPVLAWKVVGERHLKLELAAGAQRLPAIHFGGWEGEPPPARVRVAYRLAPDDWRGGNAIQLVVVHREPA